MPLLRLILVFCVLCFTLTFPAAQSEYKVAALGFYNLENLFHPSDDPDIDDAEFTPEGSNHYTEAIYQEKLDHLSDVISQLATETTPDGVAILGVCEIENRQVLEDLIAQPKLRDRKYEIVHVDSKDSRGVDVGMLYQPKYFTFDSLQSIPLVTEIAQNGDTSFSRSILFVYGKLDGEAFAISVNHWPSRRGGQQAEENRNKAAEINKKIVDANTERGIKTIVMGDLNDDPVNTSVKGILRAKTDPDRLTTKDMYNPMYQFYKRGFGTTAYQDAWSLFDQIILSSNAVEDKDGYHYYRARVFNEPFLTQKLGNWKGYPFRTYAGSTYLGGYSDHFPVYVFLVKRT